MNKQEIKPNQEMWDKIKKEDMHERSKTVIDLICSLSCSLLYMSHGFSLLSLASIFSLFPFNRIE